MRWFVCVVVFPCVCMCKPVVTSQAFVKTKQNQTSLPIPNTTLIGLTTFVHSYSSPSFCSRSMSILSIFNRLPLLPLLSSFLLVIRNDSRITIRNDSAPTIFRGLSVFFDVFFSVPGFGSTETSKRPTNNTVVKTKKTKCPTKHHHTTSDCFGKKKVGRPVQETVWESRSDQVFVGSSPYRR